eukprot:s1270_g12.t1
MKIDVYLPSGQRAAVSLPPGATVSDLKQAAQEEFNLCFLRLTWEGQCLEPRRRLEDVGLIRAATGKW